VSLGGRSQPALVIGVAAVGLLGLLLSSGRMAVAAEHAAGGTLTISPAIIDTVAGPGGGLPSITVANGTKLRFRIRIYATLVDQKLDGGLTIRTRRVDLRAAARRFAIAPHALLLPAGGTATVQVRLLRPVPAGEAVGAAVVDAVPVVPAGRVPLYRLRLLGALLIPGVRAPSAHGQVESIGIVQAGPHRLRFLVRVRNTGRVHGYTSQLRLRIRNRSGQTVFSTAQQPRVLLPGYARDFVAEVTKKLPAGRYVVEATGVFGSAPSHATASFTLASPNRLRTS
jgi:hypothetical protein